MKRGPKKDELKAELIERMAEELAQAEASHRATLEGATHEQAKPENDKDTRALEQQYLARGQAERVETMKEHLAEVRLMPTAPLGPDQKIVLGALVELAEEDEDHAGRLLFLAPQGGGTTLAKGKVQVVTPAAPLGRALMGKVVDDGFELRIAGKLRAFTVLKVR